ncbi:abscisic acid 8'-hydroxylase 1-like [Dorcoceras hygrometricum]|uniref:Abscisic acid 8'-hydroxylase 1-like n=1 Tax=Dorcoceras hygrometricum TaxID=472368 RepID=A0A2Z7ANS1_9LAMI|nr:abscisic acid 8'-hydroxylase 1-like [Dorcoceras hygrometricum]
MEFISSCSMIVALVFISAIYVLRYILKVLSYRHVQLPLPPGTMGWPYIGETFQLYSQNPNVFFASKIKKYGSIFKSHILGCPCVMISSPEAAKVVLVSKAHLFKPTFPASKERILGKQALFFHQGDYHTKLRRLVLRAFMPESIKDIVPDIESLAVRSLESWQGNLITTFEEMKTYTYNVGLISIFGKDEVLYREDLKRCYYILEKGYNSMPINVPGTLFHQAMKARKELAQIMAKILSLRRQTKGEHIDLLGSLMGEAEGLTDQQIADNIIGVIFAARDTTASVLTWMLKFLAENPSVLHAVTEEQEAIMKCKEEKEKALTWEDTKKMPITTRVIQETLRVASILSFTFREAVEDVDFNGYLIPKGWKVLPLFRNIHHSPDNFQQPEKFDPSRFEWDPLVSRESIGKTGDTGPRAPPHHQIQVDYDGPTEWHPVWTLCSSPGWFADQADPQTGLQPFALPYKFLNNNSDKNDDNNKRKTRPEEDFWWKMLEVHCICNRIRENQG